MSDLSQSIKALRRGFGMGQKEFASAVGVSQGTVSKWESGAQRPEAEPLTKLAAMAGTDVARFLQGHVGPSKSETSHVTEVKVIGYLQRGKHRASLDFEDGEYYNIQIPLPDHVNPKRCFACEVRGDFFNKIYPHGSIVVFQEAFAPSDLDSGDKVLVAMVYAADTHDYSVWYLNVIDEKIMLSSRSYNKDYDGIYFIEGARNFDTDVVSWNIIAVAVASVRMERDTPLTEPP